MQPFFYMQLLQPSANRIKKMRYNSNTAVHGRGSAQFPPNIGVAVALDVFHPKDLPVGRDFLICERTETDFPHRHIAYELHAVRGMSVGGPQ